MSEWFEIGDGEPLSTPEWNFAGLPDKFPDADALWVGPEPDDPVVFGKVTAIEGDGTRHEFATPAEYARFCARHQS